MVKKCITALMMLVLMGTASACGFLNMEGIQEDTAESKASNESVTGTSEFVMQETEVSAQSDISQTEKEKDTMQLSNDFNTHGKLSVQGVQLCDKNGEPFQLKGASTLGIVWFPQFVNKDAFATIKSWGGNLIRLAMYTQEEDGYLAGGDQEYQKQLIDTGVKAATELGMYVIIDWHILSDGNPNQSTEEAKTFFTEMTERYAGYDNVLYEICNEPNGDVSWQDVKKYAEQVIPVIRKKAPDSIIIVGTPTWSQDVDVASKDPLEGENLMYACHYYAATHKQELRDKVKAALNNGAPIFISEYSICDASGNGELNYDEAEKWAQFIDENELSYAQWNLANKEESSSLIKSSCDKASDWTDEDLTETGVWFKKRLED